MAITSGYFNSSNGDRKYNAETMSKYYVGILTKGVLANYESALVCTANNTMTVQVQPGKAYFGDGKWVEVDAVETISIDASDLVLNRIDRIVLQKDTSDAERTTKIVVKKGTPASSPVAPALTSTDYVEELSLCTVRINAKAEQIAQGNITDTRPDSTVCGFVTGVVDQLDLTDAYLQYQAGYEELIAQKEQEFDTWFESVKSVIESAKTFRSLESTYTTLADGETSIPIGISEYNQNIDTLQVFVNGFKLPGDSYSIDSATSLTLGTGLCAGAQVNIVVYKPVDDTEQ